MLTIEYVNDKNGKVKAVQVPIRQWDALTQKIKKYEQALQIKSDLQQAFKEVKLMQKGKIKKQTLSQFLDEL
ncbi:MAG: hypothetical protein HYX40_12005 [Sphingobacteriales bacterium]|nr:hypothetical protein [Sphingobacteriales bacterium]